MSGKKSEPSPELIQLRAQLEWNERCAEDAESRGQTDTCYHTDIIKLRAAIKAAEQREVKEHGKLD